MAAHGAFAGGLDVTVEGFLLGVGGRGHLREGQKRPLGRPDRHAARRQRDDDGERGRAAGGAVQGAWEARHGRTVAPKATLRQEGACAEFAGPVPYAAAAMADRPAGSNPPIIVLDGPAGAGKSTIARRLADQLGLPMLDTGALYRALALDARRRGIDWDDEAALAALAEGLGVRFERDPGAGTDRVVLGGEDVTQAIRTPEIAEGASRVSAHPAVRRALLDVQRALGARGCVAEGRDMGTVVFPDADVKLFLTAGLRARARRRRQQMIAQGQTPPPLEALEAAMARRDARDAGRAVAPLRPAADALVLDTTRLSLDEVVSEALAHIAQRRPDLVSKR